VGKLILQNIGANSTNLSLVESSERADHVLSRIEEAIASLPEQPERGVFPQELLELGIRDYRESFFKPYRTIYRVTENTVYIYLIVDGRRDMQSLLSRRLTPTTPHFLLQR